MQGASNSWIFWGCSSKTEPERSSKTCSALLGSGYKRHPWELCGGAELSSGNGNPEPWHRDRASSPSSTGTPQLWWILALPRPQADQDTARLDIGNNSLMGKVPKPWHCPGVPIPAGIESPVHVALGDSAGGQLRSVILALPPQ